MNFKVTLAQINPNLGRIDENIKKHELFIKNAIDEESDLIIFPELSLTGYYLEDGTFDVAMDRNEIENIFSDLSKKIDIVVGFVERGEDKNFYISQAYLSYGKIIHVHRKIYPPTHGMFEDLKFFGRGRKVESFNTRFGKAGILICRDFFHPSLPLIYYLKNVDFMIFVSAIPVRGGYNEKDVGIFKTTDSLISSYASRFQSFIFFVNRVGFEEGIGFMGGSSIKDPYGTTILSLPLLEETMGTKEIKTSLIEEARFKLPLRREEDVDLIVSNIEGTHDD